jgi:hypothetical protein
MQGRLAQLRLRKLGRAETFGSPQALHDLQEAQEMLIMQ